MLIVTGGTQRGIFISTGYGLEGGLTDVQSTRISRDIMVPYFKSGNYFEGIKAGINAVSDAVSGEFDADTQGGDDFNSAVFIFLGIFFLVLFMIFFFGKSGGGNTMSGPGSFGRSDRHSGGGIFWGGGFGGGFGGSSSGGSSGWGGGSFGGGSFGGGGGGSSW